MAPSLAPIHDHSDKRWGAAIGAAFIVNLCTLIGIVVFATKLLPCMKENETFIKASLLSFSGGTMLSIAVFLMLLDASRLISSGHVDEDSVQVTWRWGTMLLAGFSLSWLIHVAVSPFCGHHHPCEADSAASKGSAATDAADIVDASSYEVRVTGDSANTIHVARDAAEKTRIMCSIVIGDGVHNLFDGFIIGAAFTFCDSSFGWAIVGSTIVHEIAQEIGDFVTLTMRAGLKPLHALLVNFIAGLPIFMGVIIALAGDPSAEARGLLLAFAAGTYVNIATIECLAVVFNLRLTSKQHLISILAFVTGAVVIGLMLLNHKHCDAAEVNDHGSHAEVHDGH